MAAENFNPLSALERPLDEISERKFREVIDILERARDNPVVQRVLEQARPRLRRVRPPRQLTLRRLFYQPFEDLLTSVQQPDALARISRTVAASAWTYARATGDLSLWEPIQTAFDEAKGDQPTLLAVGERLWQWTGAMLAEAVKQAGADREIRRGLVGDRSDLMPEMARIASLLQAGARIEGIKAALPLKPIRVLVPDHLIAVREMVQNCAAGEPERAFVLLMAVAARMAVPGELFRQIAQLQLGLNRTDQMALLDRFQGVTLAEMSRSAVYVEEGRGTDPLSRTDSVRDFVMAVAAAQQGFRGEGAAKREMQRLRVNAEKAVTEVVDDANARVADAVRVGPNASIEEQVETENNLLALRKCQSFAPSVGLEGKVSESLGRIAGDIRRKSGVLLSSLAGAGLPPPPAGQEAVSAEDQIYWTVRMMELTGNADEADRIRRDGIQLLQQQQRGRV